MLCILKSIGAWLVLMIIGTNLIGLIVRGCLWMPTPVHESPDYETEVIRSEWARLVSANTTLTLIATLAAAGYLFALHHYWNWYLACAAAILMATRIPELIWELRSGSRVTRRDRPKGTFHILTTALDWASLPLIWYALCEVG